MTEIELTIDVFQWESERHSYTTKTKIIRKATTGHRLMLVSEIDGVQDESAELTDEYVAAQGPNRRKLLEAAMTLCRYA